MGTTAIRRRLLEGNWGSDLEDFITDTVALDRRAIWGSLDTSSNVFKTGCEALAVLYSRKPSVGIRRESADEARDFIGPHGALDKSHYFEMMSSVQMKTIGLREMLMRVDISDSNQIMFRPVTPDMVFAMSPAGDPMKANYLFEQRLRRNDSSGEMFWTADVYDLRDKNNPLYTVHHVEADGKLGEEMTKEFLGGDMSGGEKEQGTARRHARAIIAMIRRNGLEPLQINRWTGDRPHGGGKHGGRMSNSLLRSALEHVLDYPANSCPFRIHTAHKPRWSVYYGCQLIHEAMVQGRFVVHPKCKRLIRSLSSWTLKKSGAMDRLSEWKHAIDSLRYAVVPILDSKYSAPKFSKIPIHRK